MTDRHSDLPKTLLITVCDACLTAACWQGEFYCQEYKTAGVVNLPVSRLLALKREHPDWWLKDPQAVEWRQMGRLRV